MSNLERKNIRDKFKGATSSTPNFSVASRRSIRPPAQDTPSPISRLSTSRENLYITPEQEGQDIQESTSNFLSESREFERSSSSTRSNSFGSSSTFESSSNRRNLKTSKRNVSGNEDISEIINQNIGISCTVMAAICILILILFNSGGADFQNKITMEDLQNNFPLQFEDTWNALESGINEVKSLNKPSVFLFLYEEDAEKTLNNILANASMYAECVLNRNCDIEPIELTSSSLNTERAMLDYGYLISKFKPELETRTVMIVKNLDLISGEVAQAFHSMCDEYTPLVEKTVFFFTMEVKNLKSSQVSDIRIAEDILRHNWNSLDEDIFEPLFTRISSIVLRIVPEKI